MNSINKFILELNRPQSQVSLPVMKGDTAREWYISFSDNGKAFYIEDGVIAVFEIKRPSGTVGQMFCPIVNNATVVCSFEEFKSSTGVDIAAAEGISYCDIVLYNSFVKIASAHFSMVVTERVLTNDDIEITDDDITIMDGIILKEAERQSNETTRINNESLRVSAEASREAAESARQKATTDAISRIDNKTAEVNQKLISGAFDGEDGDDGFSPIVSIQTTQEGSVVSITDKDGTKAFAVANGEKGKDGAIVDYTIEMSLNKDNYVLTLNLKDANGNVVKTSNVDLPIENVIVSGREENDEIILTLVNGNEVRFSVTSLVDGLVSTITFNEKTQALEKEIADLKYFAIDINSFSAAPSTVEMGSTINSVILSWGTNKKPTALALDGASIDATTTSKTVTGAFTSNKTWTLEATDERGAKSTKSATLSFLNGVYYGVSNLTEITDSNGVLATFRDSLTKNLRSGKLTSFSVNAGEGEYIYYLLPKRMGACSFNVGGFDGGFSLIDTVNLTNASGYTEEYYIYRSDNAGLGQTTVKVS